MSVFRIALAALLALAVASPAAAHELWLEPLDFRVAQGEPIVANIRLGQQFRGDRMPYVDARIVRLDRVDEAGTSKVEGILGDMPAVSVTAEQPGLNTLVYVTTAERLGWSEWSKFHDFVTDHGLDWVLEAHRDRGLPEVGFQEAYSRCAKALVQVGAGSDGMDRELGLPVELVADANPYALTTADTLPVRALWQGEPFADALIRVFRRKHENVTITDIRADADGRADIPLAGGGVFLVSAVKMAEGSEQPKDAWHSWWASLTFEVAPR